MADLPDGTVTLLFTDIDGSTRLVQDLGDRWADVLAEHRRLLRAAVHDGHGYEVDTAGDGFFASFARARDAVSAAVAAQRALIAHAWPEGTAVRVRMGLHTGEPMRVEGGYTGLDVHRAARIAGAAHGQQILLSASTRALMGDDLPPDVSLRDLGTYRLRDLTQPQHLFQVIAPGLTPEFPPLRSLDTLPNNLSRQLTSFVGRDVEIGDLRRLLTTTALLTLTGPGGSGKTRLALQLAADSLEAFPDGAWLVDLAPLADPALVVRTVASVFGIPEDLPRPVIETLTDFLRPRSLLLILDNCEHLLAACAHLTDALLRRCPALKILATSREGLAVAGERIYRVPSLSVPDSGQAAPPEALARFEAVRLFVDRAALGKPGFALTQGNAPAVAEVCWRLDGIPLAIELAASRVAAMSIQDIRKRLNDRFRLLTGGSRAAMPRQQTLRAALDWSYDLLSEPERTVLRRLAAFEGGFTLEAAEAVCPGEDLNAADVPDHLAHLVEKSMVAADDEPHGVRYRLLETVRQYSRDKLLESGEAAQVRARHRDLFLRLAEEAEPHLTAADEVQWLERLETEQANMRTASSWSLETGGDVEAGLRLAGALGWFWYVRGHLTEGRHWLDRALVDAEAAAPSIRAKALLQAGLLAGGQGEYGTSMRLSAEALRLYEQTQDHGGVARALYQRGFLEFHSQNFEASAQFLERSLTLFRALGDRWGAASALRFLGSIASLRGDARRAAEVLEESLALYSAIGHKRGVGHATFHLAIATEVATGAHREARALLEEGLVRFHEVGDRMGVGLAHIALAHIARREGSHDQAVALFRQTLGPLRDLGNMRYVAACLDGLASVAAAVGTPQRAARLFGAADALRNAVGASQSFFPLLDYEDGVAAARAALGAQAFAAAWAQGQTLTLDDAIAEALEEGTPPH